MTDDPRTSPAEEWRHLKDAIIDLAARPILDWASRHTCLLWVLVGCYAAVLVVLALGGWLW